MLKLMQVKLFTYFGLGLGLELVHVVENLYHRVRVMESSTGLGLGLLHQVDPG